MELTAYKPRNFIVRKLKIDPFGGKNIPMSGSCIYLMVGKKSSNIKQFIFDWGCYNIYAVGKKFRESNSQICYEKWDKKGANITLDLVECSDSKEDYIFSPSGWFHHSYIHLNLDQRPEKGRKDSLSLSVGKCSLIE